MSILNDNWEKIFNKYKIIEKLSEINTFEITANQIKEFKEPRLMTKFDTKESLPKIFSDNKLDILPNTRGTYIIGHFDLYKDFPERLDSTKNIQYVQMPDYLETLDVNNIFSESVAINAMSIGSMLDHFLNENKLISTISGRMSSGSFSFNVGNSNQKYNISVKNSQIEIDGGFENQNIVSLIEAKNIIHSNFLIRQLYYPYRTWSNKITKPIKPVFLIYSNNIFRLLEYDFQDINNYNSISLVKEGFYSFENPCITLTDIQKLVMEVNIRKEPDVTFPQANDFDKVVSLLEQLKKSPLTTSEIADNFGFDERQSDYYYNAAKYLGFAKKTHDEQSQKVVILTEHAKRIFEHSYKEKQLIYADAILQHQIFYEIMKKALDTGEIPNNTYIARMMKALNCCSNNLLVRRSSTVSSWIRWILKLINN